MNIEFTLTLIIYLWEILYYPVFLQIAELKAKRDQNQDQEKQMKTRIEHLEKTVKHQQQELKKRASQVSQFERVRKAFNDYFLWQSSLRRKCFCGYGLAAVDRAFCRLRKSWGELSVVMYVSQSPSFARPKSEKSLRLRSKPYRKKRLLCFSKWRKSKNLLSPRVFTGHVSPAAAKTECCRRLQSPLLRG